MKTSHLSGVQLNPSSRLMMRSGNRGSHAFFEQLYENGVKLSRDDLLRIRSWVTNALEEVE